MNPSRSEGFSLSPSDGGRVGARRPLFAHGSWKFFPIKILLTVGGLVFLAAVNAIAAEEKAQSINYARVAEPSIPMELLPLPPGAVEPAGWLRDWAVAAHNGITGHLDERHPTFAEGWKGIPIKAPGAGSDGTGWPLEQSAYWLDGALRLGFVLHDQALIQKIRARLDPIVDGVNNCDSWTSFIYWKKGYQPEGFNAWAHSQIGRALLALYQGTGEKRVLDAMVKVYAGYPVSMGALEPGNVSGSCNLDPMLEAYSYSGDRRLLDRALQAIAQTNITSVIAGWREGQVFPGHMVILYENARLPAVVYPWSGNPVHLTETLGALNWVETNHLLPYGVASGEEFASGIGAFRKTETCDVAAMLLASCWMYRVQGEGAWGDRMEQAFFNAGAAPIARDFQTMCYYQSPNRLRSDSLPCEQPLCPGPEGNRFHSLGCPTVLCCVGAVNRILPQYIIHMWMATRDNGLAASLHGPCTVSALAGARVPVTIHTETAYPFEEIVRMRISPERDAKFPLYLRIPGWCSDPLLKVNGTKVKTLRLHRGFVKIERTWSQGDRIELCLPMQPCVNLGYETEFPADNRKYFGFESAKLFERRRLPYASLACGPLHFALAIPDLAPNTPAPGAKWQYALDANPSKTNFGIEVERSPMPSHWDWPLEAPVKLKVAARGFDWHPTDDQALPAQPVNGDRDESIKLVPYGCTKFRISMFPVTPRLWGAQTQKSFSTEKKD